MSMYIIGTVLIIFIALAYDLIKPAIIPGKHFQMFAGMVEIMTKKYDLNNEEVLEEGMKLLKELQSYRREAIKEGIK